MANLTKTVDKTQVAGSESFIYTFQVSYSGLVQPAQNGELTDFFPSKIIYVLPEIGSPVKNIIQKPVTGGTNVTFQFGQVSAGTSFSFTVACRFGPGRVDNDIFTNTGNLYADGTKVAESTAQTVTLRLTEGFQLLKEYTPAGLVRPGQVLTFHLILFNTKDGGAEIANVVITDILPPKLIPDTSILPVGTDIPESGYSDSLYNGRTGEWDGQKLTFTLPSYHGVRYSIAFTARVSEAVTPGETFTNTGEWTAEGEERLPSNVILRVFSDADKFGLEKSGNRTGAIGKPIFYSIVNKNQDTVPLHNYRLTDALPDEVDITRITFISQPSSLPSYSIYITTSDGGGKILVLEHHAGNSGSIDLTPFIPLGARVTTVEITAPVLEVSALIHFLSLYGKVNQTGIVGETIINTAIAAADEGTETVTYNTVLNGQSDLTAQKAIVPAQSSYSPLEEFKIALSTGPLNTFTIAPIFADLLPDSIHYVPDSEYVIYIESSTGKTYDSRLPGFPVPLPDRVMIDNFDNTGRTLIRWSFLDFTLPMGDKLQIFFTCFVKITVASSFKNEAFVGNPGRDVLFVYTAVKDDRDYDGDGITDEIISSAQAEGVILTTSEFSIKKRVKGELNLEFGSSGTTTPGGNLTYQLLVTNNQRIDLKNLELVDIFPYVGDTGVMLTNEPRGSSFYVYPTNVVSAEIVNVLGLPVPVQPAITVWYSVSNDPVRFDAFGSPIGTGAWSLTPPADITALRSVKITTGPDTILHPYERLIVTVQAKTPNDVPNGHMAYNSFAARADQIFGDETEPLLPTEPNKVGISVVFPAGGSIGRFVWEDLNKNGIYDSTEPGVNGITVELYNSEMQKIAATVTSNNHAMEPGYYTFNNLSAGDYYVKFIPPATCVLTVQREAVEGGSKPDEITGVTSVIPLLIGQQRTDINAGVVCECQENPYAQAFTDLITSVALEETGLSHILNAEGEKLQKAIMLTKESGELLAVNQSVEEMVRAVSRLEGELGKKLRLFECIVCEEKECR